MTEYDFSSDAYERYLDCQSRVSNWVSQANMHANEFVDPISDPPHRRKSSFYSQSSSSSESFKDPRFAARSYPAQRSRPVGRPSRRPRSPSASSSSSCTSSCSSPRPDRAPINPYSYYPGYSHNAHEPSHHIRFHQQQPQQQQQQQQPHSPASYGSQAIPIHKPTPIRAPFQPAQWTTPPNAKFVVLDGSPRNVYATTTVSNPPPFGYPKPNSNLPPNYFQPMPFNSYPAPPVPSHRVQYPSHHHSGYYTHSPPFAGHHPPPQPQRPLLKRMIGSLYRQGDSGRRNSRRDY